MFVRRVSAIPPFTIIILGRGGVLGQGKGSGSWVKKRLMGILAVTGYGNV